MHQIHWDLADKHADLALAAWAMGKGHSARVHTDAAVHHYREALAASSRIDHLASTRGPETERETG